MSDHFIKFFGNISIKDVYITSNTIKKKLFVNIIKYVLELYTIPVGADSKKHC